MLYFDQMDIDEVIFISYKCCNYYNLFHLNKVKVHKLYQ